jgi:signal transduction histidine kinase
MTSPKPSTREGSVVTRRPAKDSEADALLRKKRILAALVVHDLRNPLSGAQSYLDLIKEELGDSKSAVMAGYLEDCTELLQRAMALVASILDVDELEAGILKARPAPVRLLELVEQSRLGSQREYQRRGIQFRCDVAPEEVVVLDPELFGRLLENLLDNATRYTPRGGQVAVLCRRIGEELEVAVGNDGPVVPAAQREAIFARHYQLEQRRQGARANRGLGLYFCRLAAEAHDGTLTVDERPPLGTVFIIRVPQPR